MLFDAEPETTKPPRRTKATVPATRIPDDFAVTSGMREWAAKNIPGFDFDAETENFADYWRAKAGTAATKADWPATWRTWMRRAAREAPQAPRYNSRRSGHQPFRNVNPDDALGFGYDV